VNQHGITRHGALSKKCEAIKRRERKTKTALLVCVCVWCVWWCVSSVAGGWWCGKVVGAFYLLLVQQMNAENGCRTVRGAKIIMIYSTGTGNDALLVTADATTVYLIINFTSTTFSLPRAYISKK
jgi:hypothetical protein